MEGKATYHPFRRIAGFNDVAPTHLVQCFTRPERRAVVALVAVVSLVATLVPARRATHVDLLIALRAE